MTSERENQRDRRQAALNFAGCCLLYAGANGVGGNCRGIFYAPVAAGLGVSLSVLNLASLFYGVTAALAMGLWCRLFARLPSRRFLGAVTLAYGGSFLLLGTVRHVAVFYLYNILQGCVGGFLLFYPLPTIISNWFPARKGTMLGMAVLSSGVAGIIVNPLAESWIARYGWQRAYLLTGALILALCVPAALLLVSRDPAEVGCRPLGQAPAADPAPNGGAGRTPAATVRLLFVFLVLLAAYTALPQHLPNYALTRGQSAAFGARLVSASMLGNLLSKLLFGPLNDRLGAQRTTFLSFLPVAAACLALMLPLPAWGLYTAAFCTGIVLTVLSLQLPLLFRTLCTPADYDRLYPRVCSLNILICAASQSLLSVGYNLDPSYRLVLVVGAALMLVCAVIPLFARAA